MFDPGQNIPILSQKPLTPVSPGNTSLPYNIAGSPFPRVKKENQKEYLYYPLFPITTQEETIIEGATIPLIHNAPNFNAQTDWRIIQLLVRCIDSQHGYTVGQETTINFGANFEISDTEVLVNVMADGIKIIKKNNNRQQGRVDVNKWRLFARCLFFVSLLD